MNELCANIVSEFQNNDDMPYEYVINLAYAIIAILSIIGLCIVALSIFYNKQLGEHPSPLIANICIVEAIMCYNTLMSFLTPKYMVCYFNVYTYLGIST